MNDEHCLTSDLPVEILILVIKRCNAADIINLSATCRTLYTALTACQQEWKNLCAEDFDVHLTTQGKFASYKDVYRLLYASRILTGSYIYGRYYSKLKVGE